MNASLEFTKYQALGNDYLVVEPVIEMNAEIARRLCDRHYGVGADGVLLGPLPSTTADYGLRIYNPDGSLAEKSGNGLRIFAHYLWDTGRVQEAPFSVQTAGGLVKIRVYPGGSPVTVEMGRARFESPAPKPSGLPTEHLTVGSRTLPVCAVNIGNPHCVVLRPATPEETQTWGPLIERLPRFPNRTNVQFLEVLDRTNLRIEIWERGAGYTFASGSSACAAAAAAHRLHLCDAAVTVHMPGGALQVAIDPDGMITLTGPVTPVFRGQWLESGGPS